MANKYLFACPCGRKTTIEPTQAGQVLRCACGAEHTLPTMLEIGRLEPVSSPPGARPAAAWAVRERLVFLGAVLLAGGLLMAGAVGWNWPVAPPPATPERIRAEIDALTVLQSLRVWGDVLRGLDARPRRDERSYREAVLWSQRWLMVAAAIGVVGLAVMGWGFVAGYSGRRRPR